MLSSYILQLLTVGPRYQNTVTVGKSLIILSITVALCNLAED